MAKRKEEHEKENAERWLLTYSDMITLLMLFFIVLYSMSTIDAAKYEELSEALTEVFDGGNLGIFEMKAGAKGTLEGVEKPAVVDKSKQEDKRKRLEEELRKLVQGNNIMVTETADGLSISLYSDLYFPPGGEVISDEGYAALRTVAPALSGLSNEIRVEGHTDSSPPDRKGETNWELSSRRALAVLETLESYGVQPERLSAVAKGSTRPIRSNDTPEGRSYNRRVEIVVVFDKTEAKK